MRVKLPAINKNERPPSGNSIRSLRRAANSGFYLREPDRVAKLRHRRGLRGHETAGFAN